MVRGESKALQLRIVREGVAHPVRWPCSTPEADTFVNQRSPIFVVGSGRCGSTVFHDLLSQHPGTEWLSSICNSNPAKSERNALVMRSLRVPGLGKVVRRIYPPSEVYSMWDRLCPGFSEPYRDLEARDVTIGVKHRIREAFRRASSAAGVPLLTKLTGWPRIGFLKEVFPRARFIVLTRDGRAVVASGMDVPWSRIRHGPERWRFGRLSEEDWAIWQSCDRSFVALEALGWQRVIRAQETAIEGIDAADVLELRYETMCADPEQVFRTAAEFCTLPWSAGFAATIRAAKLRNQNHKWREHFTTAQQEEIQCCIGPTLERLGYNSTVQ